VVVYEERVVVDEDEDESIPNHGRGRGPWGGVLRARGMVGTAEKTGAGGVSMGGGIDFMDSHLYDICECW